MPTPSHFQVPEVFDAELQQRAELAIGNARFIKPEQDLEVLASEWQSVPVVGLDTEFVRERTFFARPGLIQIYGGRAIYLIDPVGRHDHAPLAQLMADSETTKVFHSVGEDLEIMQQVCGQLPSPLFDTQIGAAMLGFPLQCRYETLVEACFGAELPGGQARSDWCKRPLAESLLEYAAADVAWLLELERELRAALGKAGRLSWLEEDCRRLIERARSGDERPPLLRVKGAGRLSETALGWLDKLARWRDHQARDRDLPRSFVIRDEIMIEMAEQLARGKTRHALNALPDRQRRLAASLETLFNDPPEAIERPVELQRLEPAQREAIKRAQDEVRKIADQLGIDPALLASKRELTRLTQGERPDWLEGWRGELIGHLADA